MNKKAYIFAAIAFIAIAAVIAYSYAGSGYYLSIKNDRTGETVYSEKLENNGTFSISYIHSVNKSEVEEYYINKDGVIYLTDLRYSAFGAGMATEVTPPQTLEMKDGEMWVHGFDEKLTHLGYFVGMVCSNTLHAGGKSIRLDTLAAPRTPITIEIIKH